MQKEYETKIKEQADVIKRQESTIDKLNREIAWLRRKVWGQSSERHANDDAALLSFDFGELKLTPEEEAAYKKAETTADAFREHRKDEAEIRSDPRRAGVQVPVDGGQFPAGKADYFLQQCLSDSLSTGPGALTTRSIISGASPTPSAPSSPPFSPGRTHRWEPGLARGRRPGRRRGSSPRR